MAELLENELLGSAVALIFADGDRNRSGRKTRPADESAVFDLDRRIAGKSVELEGGEVTKDQALLLFSNKRD
jgi:hypothetical protein